MNFDQSFVRRTRATRYYPQPNGKTLAVPNNSEVTEYSFVIGQRMYQKFNPNKKYRRKTTRNVPLSTLQ